MYCQIYAAIQKINGFEPTEGLDFLLTGERFPTYLGVFMVMDVTDRWLWITISYAASARKDFAVGFFAASIS